MKIGEFAKICGTKISVLRHYDKEGLLQPDHIDKFTGYRYYSKKQISDYFRISALKKANFSLTEIKSMLDANTSDSDILHFFDIKEKYLTEIMLNLKDAKKIIIGVNSMNEITFTKENNCIIAKTQLTDNAQEILEKELTHQGYQRISSYKKTNTDIFCNVIKLNDNATSLSENINLPFENDISIIGKWETVGEFAVKEDFYSGENHDELNLFRNANGLYFLPNGERYWCYGWTNGKLLIDNGSETYANNYTTETYNGIHYMFIEYKSYNYRHGGNPTVLVLKQLDNNSYTAGEIARKDDTNMPFINDEQIIGKWKAYSFIKTKDDFNTSKQLANSWYWSDVEFLKNGEVISHYDWGNELISGRDSQEWTKGYLLRKWNNSACAYEIRVVNKTEYLIIEWKSGDYRYGGFDTDYYVFVRDNEQ